MNDCYTSRKWKNRESLASSPLRCIVNGNYLCRKYARKGKKEVRNIVNTLSGLEGTFILK